MKLSLLITAPAIASLVLIGCGSKQKTKTVTTSPLDQQLGSRIAKTERASGELREALLQLRRVHFAFDTDAILLEGRTSLEEAARLLRSHPNVQVYIDGHTDERGTSEYNLALGERRARAVSSYLTRLGIPGERLQIMTFGKEQPRDNGQGELANAKNRRAEFRLMRGDVRLILEEGALYNDKGRRIATGPQ